MEDLARPIDFSSYKMKTTSTVTLRDIAWFLLRALSLIPGVTFLLLMVAGILLDPFGISVGPNLLLIGSMHAVFIAMVILNWIMDKHSLGRLTSTRMNLTYIAEAVWLLALISAW